MKRVALIGYGYWGPNLLRNLFDAESCEVAYCCDLSKERLKLAKKRYPSVNTTTDIDEVMNDKSVDGVIIATPTRTHFQLAQKALMSGKDVLIEKPMVMNVKEAKVLINLANKKKRIVMVDHTFLFNDAVMRVKKLIDDGELGDIIYIDSVRANLGLFQPDVNVIYDLASHDFSIIQYLLGKNPISIQATGKSHFNKQEDIAYVTAEYPNNIMAHVHISWLSPLKVRRMFIIGTKKMIVYDDTEPAEKIRIYDKGVTTQTDDSVIAEQIKIGYRSGDVWLPKIDVIEALGLLINEFVESMETRKQPKSGGKFVQTVMEMLEAATTSIRSDRKVKF